MQASAHDPQPVTASVNLYQMLVSAYPRAFRQDYAEPMLQLFRDCCRRAYLDGGAPSMLALWTRTLLDYLTTIVEEYARGVTDMRRSKFIKLSGWALMLAAVTLVAGFGIGGGETYYDDPLGGIDGFYEYSQLILIPTALFLYTVGMAGFLFRYGETSGRLGKIGLVIAVVGGFSGFLSAIPLYALIAPWLGSWWYFMIYSILGMLVGLSLFGVSAIRSKPMVRWNALPLLTAVWFPIVLVIQTIVWLSNSSMDSLDYLGAVAMLFWVVGSIGLGYLLQKDAQHGGPASPIQA